jgi:hypothetical protein
MIFLPEIVSPSNKRRKHKQHREALEKTTKGGFLEKTTFVKIPYSYPSNNKPYY